MDLEAQRNENLKHKAKLLADLQLDTQLSQATSHDSTKRPAKKPKVLLDSKPTRSSARIACSSNRPSYKEEHNERYKYPTTKLRSRPSHGTHEDTEPHSTSLFRVNNVEELRAGWTRWKPVASPPARDENGTYHFPDYPTFNPNKSPEEVMREGCFGGSYFRKLRSKKLGITIEKDWQDLPSTWYDGLDADKFMTSTVYDSAVNKYKVACGQSIEEWEANGWINLEHDVRGWFQWYCRFFLGRRCQDDERQVSRWRRCVGPTGRWRRMLLKKYLALGVRAVVDRDDDDDNNNNNRTNNTNNTNHKHVSPVMHQTCHHWAYAVTQQDLDAAWNTNR